MKKAIEAARELRKRQTPAEEIFWEAVRKRKINGKKFVRQYPLYFEWEGKRRFVIADFYCHEKRLVIEIDGKIHERQKEEDRLRDNVMNQMGLRIIRFSNEEIEKNLKKALKKLEKVL